MTGEDVKIMEGKMMFEPEQTPHPILSPRPQGEGFRFAPLVFAPPLPISRSSLFRKAAVQPPREQVQAVPALFPLFGERAG